MITDINDCYLNIPKSERESHLYRIISLPHLYELFEKHTNVLVKPHKWDDPFENFILGLKAQLPTGETVEFGQRHNFFGQCWTLKASSDAMWRIYSSDKKSVRIRSRIRKLVETFDRTAIGLTFIGKVHYLSTQGLLAWARRVFRNADEPSIRLLAKTLLVKREAFSHEEEVRLLYLEPEAGRELFPYRVDPQALVEEIVVDPRLAEEDAQKLMDEIRVRTRFRGPIAHSNLYAPPRELVLHLGTAYAALNRSAAKVTYVNGARQVAVDLRSEPTQLVFPPGTANKTATTRRKNSKQGR